MHTLLWSDTLQFALEGVEIGDDGYVAGYAHVNKTNFDVGATDGEGGLHLVLWSPQGTRKLDEFRKYYDRGFYDFIADRLRPTATHAILDSENNRLLFRIEDICGWRECSVWWSYQLSDPSQMSRVAGLPEVSEKTRVPQLVAAHPIPSTRLLLEHWHTMTANEQPLVSGGRRAGCLRGAIFVLTDQKFETVWSLSLPEAYSGSSNGSISVLPHSSEFSIPGFKILPEKLSFEVFDPSRNLRIEYSIKSGKESDWLIMQSGKAELVHQPD